MTQGSHRGARGALEEQGSIFNEVGRQSDLLSGAREMSEVEPDSIVISEVGQGARVMPMAVTCICVLFRAERQSDVLSQAKRHINVGQAGSWLGALDKKFSPDKWLFSRSSVAFIPFLLLCSSHMRWFQSRKSLLKC